MYCNYEEDDMDLEMKLILSSLQKPNTQRTSEDVGILLAYLQQQPNLRELNKDDLKRLCSEAHYERHFGNGILYRCGDAATCWYILLSGSVMIDNMLYVPNKSFGTKESDCDIRSNDCIVLETSEMMVIDNHSSGRPRIDSPVIRDNNSHSFRCNRPLRYSDGSLYDDQYPDDLISVNSASASSQGGLLCVDRNGWSKTSDTSSLYSAAGSDMMLSSADDQVPDLTGLLESAVDSDDEECYGGENKAGIVHDALRECLEKKSEERTEQDIEVILDSIQHLQAFNNMTLATRRALCAFMVYAVIDDVDKIVMANGEKLDSWSVILNGEVEVARPDGTLQVYRSGESFGILPSTEAQFHKGTMHTKTEDCQFVCIPQEKFCQIQLEGEENIHHTTENGKVVLITEERAVEGRSEKGRIIIRGTPDQLLKELMDEQTYDTTYLGDFLLTYRTFFKSPTEVASKLLEWFDQQQKREKVVSVVLDWVNMHYTDFDTEPGMMEFLEQLEGRLEKLEMNDHLRLLNISCGHKARPRTIVLSRASRDEILNFSVLGGQERGCGIFVTKVVDGSKANEVGLKRGDQILEVNNQSFTNISHNRALDILRGSTHLSITVKSNRLGFKEMVSMPLHAPKLNKSKSKHLMQHLRSESNLGKSAQNRTVQPVIMRTENGKSRSDDGMKPNGHASKIRNTLMKMILPRNMTSDSIVRQNSRGSGSNGSSPLMKNRFSSSHPDLSSLQLYKSDTLSNHPDNVLKVYREDQTFKYLLIFKETSANEVVMLAVQEFGITHSASLNFSLCEVTVQGENFVKQRRLPDQLQNLADRCSLQSRYYLKNNSSTETLLPDDAIEDFWRECQINFLLLDCPEIAAQLTLRDFQLFCSIQQIEYVNELFKCGSSYGSPQLEKFSELSNVEMFWVVTQICLEHSISNRVKAIKHFIQIANHCIQCKNYNSAFAIISGLGHQSVTRLKQTWDKLPSKYLKLFEDLQNLMDPSRNMYKYRNLVNRQVPPMIPFYPLINKDLTFIHLGNDSIVEGLVNFEKLRMVAKEVKHISQMAPPYSEINSSSINSSAAAMLRRRIGGLNSQNAKKVYEESQMVRRVRAYLSSFKPIEDELQLAEMSNCCESAGVLVKRQDTNSSNSSSIKLSIPLNNGPKFVSGSGHGKASPINVPSKSIGTDSPDNARKMLALSDGARPFDGRRLRPGPEAGLTLKSMSSTGVHPRSLPSSGLQESSTILLSPESSSVVSIGQPKQRTKYASGSNSVPLSSNSGQNGSGAQKPRAVETDSGHYSCSSSTGDNNSMGSVGSNNSPPDRNGKSPDLPALMLQSLPQTDLSQKSQSRCQISIFDSGNSYNVSGGAGQDSVNNTKKSKLPFNGGISSAEKVASLTGFQTQNNPVKQPQHHSSVLRLPTQQNKQNGDISLILESDEQISAV